MEHFTIKPDDGSKKLHVHRDGSSTQGRQRRDLDAVEHLLDEREIDMLEFHRRSALQARAIYHEAFDRTVANALL